MSTRSRLIIHWLVVLAMVTSIASPACEFISGKSLWTVICGSSGEEAKTAAIPEEYKPFLLTQENGQSPPAEDHPEKPDCSFCLAFAAQKLKKADAAALSAPVLAAGRLVVGPGLTVFTAQIHTPFAPRGPPALSLS